VSPSPPSQPEQYEAIDEESDGRTNSEHEVNTTNVPTLHLERCMNRGGRRNHISRELAFGLKEEGHVLSGKAGGSGAISANVQNLSVPERQAIAR